VQSCRAAVRSKPGSGIAVPLFLLPKPAARLCVEEEGDVLGSPVVREDEGFRFPCESTDVRDATCRTRDSERESVESRRTEPLELTRWRDGRTSFFCLEAGRISSRSTGTPSETKNSRLIRDRIQSGGWRGGGATSCDQSEALRGVRNTGLSLGTEGSKGGVSSSGGKRALRYGSVELKISEALRSLKSGTGYEAGSCLSHGIMQMWKALHTKDRAGADSMDGSGGGAGAGAETSAS